VQFGYGQNYLVDVEYAIIVEVEATPRTYDEVAATCAMIERTQRRLKLSLKRLAAADTAYGTGKFLAFVTYAGIIPHIAVWDTSKRDDGTFPSVSVQVDWRTAHRSRRRGAGRGCAERRDRCPVRIGFEVRRGA
jgi:hypothetical protein